LHKGNQPQLAGGPTLPSSLAQLASQGLGILPVFFGRIDVRLDVGHSFGDEAPEAKARVGLNQRCI
jgi:hypothetical protein